MASFSAALRHGRQFFASPKRRNWFGLLIVLVIIFSLMRGCSVSYPENQSYKIGQDTRWSTLNVMNKERELSAFSVDLLTSIAKQENVQFILQPTSGNVLTRRLDSGELDGIISTMLPTPINQSSYVFSEPYFLLGPVLVISSRERLKGWNEMAVKIIGVQSNLPSLLNLEKDPSIRLRIYNNILRALADLDDQSIDGVIFPALPAHIYTNTFYEGKLKIATSPLTDEGLRLVARKNERGQALIDLFNSGLKELKDNNVYTELLTQWGFSDFEKFEN